MYFSFPAYIEVMLSLHQKQKQLFTTLTEHALMLENHPIETIHQMRKLTKHMRALLRLEAPASTKINHTLKILSRILAPYRDAQVNLETYELLILNKNSIQSPGVVERLQSNPYYRQPIPDPNHLEEVNCQLSLLQNEMLVHKFLTKSDTIMSAIQKSYAAGLKSMRQASVDQNSETLHTWRKKTKRLWYQLHFLFGDKIEDTDHPVKSSDCLGKTLGEIHDLDVLESLLSSEHDIVLIEFIYQKRRTLLEQAFDSGETLYIEQDATLQALLLKI